MAPAATAVALVLALATPGALPPAASPPDPLRFTRLSIEDGLSHSHVWSVLQDHQGFMWFGTELGGLNRYDGNEVKVYRHLPKDPRSLIHNFARVLYEDRENTLWVGTNGGGLDRYDRDTDSFVHYRHEPGDPHTLPHDNVKAILEDSTGILWIGSDGGLSRFDRATGTFHTRMHDPADPRSPSGDRIAAVLEDRRTGLLWLSVIDHGVDVFDRASGRVRTYAHDPANPRSLSHDVTRALSQDRNGDIWVATRVGLNRFDGESPGFTRFHHDSTKPDSLADDSVTKLHEDSRGRYWVTTLDGLDRLDPKTGACVHYRHDPGDPNSLPDDRVRMMYEDPTGALWFGTTNGGVARLAAETERFVTYRNNPGSPTSLSHSAVLSLHVDGEGTVWIGTAGGLNRFDGRTFEHYRHDPKDPRSLSYDDVRAIAEGPPGTLWLGTSGGGLCRLERGRFTGYRADPADPGALSSEVINAVFVDSGGGLWIAAHDVGLDFFDGKTFTHYRAEPGRPGKLPSGHVLSILEGEPESLWLGTSDMGLVLFERGPGRFTPYLLDPHHPQSEAANRVHVVHADGSGGLWLGADSGLFRFDIASRTFTHHYTTADGLPADAVVSVLGDGDGSLWLGTPSGLARLDPARGSLRVYGGADGLQGNQFNSRSCARAKDGRLFFGGVAGFSVFDPRRLADNPHVPPVVFTGFDLFRRPVEIGGTGSPLAKAIHVAEQVTLRHDQSVFGIRFAALDFAAPRSNRYAYRMEGFDPDWTRTDAREATYTNLNPGTYVFRVRGSNNNGVWNETGRALRITVLPPWWRTVWFKGLAGLAAGGLLFAVHRLRVGAVERRERATRAALEEKVLLLKEIHHRVKNNLQVICSLLNLEAGNTNDAEARERLLDSQGRVRIMAMIHEKLYESGDLARFDAEYLRTLVTSTVYSHGRAEDHVRTEIEVDDLRLDADTAIPLGLLVNELVTNALKHAFPGGRPGTIRVELRSPAAGELHLRVADDGIGLPEGVGTHGAGTLGLQLVEALVAQLNGTLETSREGGTSFDMRLRVARYKPRV